MKTYRLFSLRVLQPHEKGVSQVDIPLQDGLIIDMEDTAKKWLIDAVINQDGIGIFETCEKENGKLIIEAVITSENNYPATMVTKVRKITHLSNKVSILLDGLMAVRKDDIIDVILESIVDEGLTGDALLEEFKKRKATRGVEKIVENIYKQVNADEKLSFHSTEPSEK
ncbi:YwpF family protein [Alkalihalobacterium chitinilyticum]|uniref:YwpF-like family protein n=1 Tax=Alkalihalobacterium chitinilyticum TaxID=2980103 RepID=A0ABT5VK87_9BACI|nr:YwpF family protein [Alkalihalobacterium chitinilyticum]MDE5415695.1 YwpF-like family protein [Alkalihalobacterium chitinilyticum]